MVIFVVPRPHTGAQESLLFPTPQCYPNRAPGTYAQGSEDAHGRRGSTSALGAKRHEANQAQPYRKAHCRLANHPRDVAPFNPLYRKEAGLHQMTRRKDHVEDLTSQRLGDRVPVANPLPYDEKQQPYQPVNR